MSQKTVIVNSAGVEQQFDALGSGLDSANAASEAVVVNSAGVEQTVETAGGVSPIPPQLQQVVLVNSAGVEQTVETAGGVSPIPPQFVRGVIVDASGAEVTVESPGGVSPIPPQFRRLRVVNSDGTDQTFTVGTPLSLTLSGNEITDAARAAGVQGDGLAPEGSMGVWEATTNLVANGGFETNDTGWTDVSATTTRVTAQQKFGSASCEVVTGNATANEGCYHNFTATAAAYTVSAWVRGAGGGTVRLAVRDNAGGSAQTGSAVTLTSTWQRISLTTTNLTAATWRCYVETNTQQNITFQVDGVQAELQPLPTPYVETNGGTASRSASRVQVPVANALDETQGWVAMRARMPTNRADAGSSAGLFQWLDDSNNRIQCQIDPSSGVYMFRRLAGVGGIAFEPGTWSAGDSITAIFAWTATEIAASLNGTSFATSGNTNIPTLAASLADVGVVDYPSNHADAAIFWLACGTGTLTDTDAANIHANGNSDPPKGLFPTAAAVKLIWGATDGTARSYT